MKSKEVLSIERGRTDTRKGERSKEKSGRVEEQKGKDHQDEAGLKEMDEDERDRRNLEDIQRRMEARKLARDVESAKSLPDSHATTEAVTTIGTTIGKNVVEKTTTSRRNKTKVGCVADKPASSDVGQRAAARQWAEGDTSNETSSTRSRDEKGLRRPRTTPQEINDKPVDPTIKDQENLYAQEFIALQYSAAKEGVSSTERLGLSFVSGAMGRRTDDPKMFETSVELIDCSAPFRTTKEKAQVEVSNPPPNSIDSEVEEDESRGVHLSQSTTDMGVQIELPEGNAEIGDQEVGGTIDKGLSKGVGIAGESSTTSGSMGTPSRLCHEGGSMTEVKKATPRSVILSEYNKLIEEIDASALMQEELRRTEPNLASASSFLNIVCGGTKRKRGVK